jgi:diphthine synthase
MAGELVFIGLGLHDEEGLSIRGQREAKSCDFLFAEFYTAVMPGLGTDGLERLVGKQVQVLSRNEVEEKPERIILSKSKTNKVGFLVPGDPMVATTHVDLRIRAEKAGIRTRVIHAASVVTAAAGVTGLQSYKFGRTVTIPVSSQTQFPETILTNIKANFEAGLHTLVLLEIDVENNRHVTIREALKSIVCNQPEKASTVGSGTLVVGIARLESPDMIVKAGTVTDLARTEFGEPPYVLIIPSRLHFMESEALELFCGAPRELVNQIHD